METHILVRLISLTKPTRGGDANLTVYLGTGIQNSSSITSPTSQTPSASSQHSPPSAISRLRASSSVFPGGLNLGNQYRTLPPQHNTPTPPMPRSHSFSTPFTTGYASAPLAAPVDFSLPRTPVESGRRDFSIPQLSAPMAPPQDFQNAYTSALSPPRVKQNDREYNNQGSNSSALANRTQVQSPDQPHLRAIKHEDVSYSGASEHSINQTRKRSFTMPGAFGAS